MSSSGDDGVTGGGFLDRSSDTSVAEAIRRVFTAPLLAVAGGLAYLVSTAFESISRIGQVIDAGWAFLSSLITEPISILEITSAASGFAIADNFGIVAFPVGVAVIILGFVLWELSGLGIPIVDEIIPWRGD